VTRLEGKTLVVRETQAMVKRKALVVELSALTLRIRLKGARWSYDVDYESIFVLGARKAADQQRDERAAQKRRRRGWR
jgi:hypothetical protein